MYILIRIGHNDNRSNELVSKKKSTLVNLLKEKDYYWSRIANRYIDDETSGIEGGSGVDYVIEKCEEI